MTSWDESNNHLFAQYYIESYHNKKLSKLFLNLKRAKEEK